MYRILFLEDNTDDVELMKFELSQANLDFTSKHIVRKEDFLASVKDFHPHIILADYSLPMFNGMQAFRLLQEQKINVPFILVTGVLSEQFALACLKEGIDDFILKSSFTRLPAAIINAIEKKKLEVERKSMATSLQKTNKELQLLTERLHRMREEERQSIARDLHDELGQMLTALKIDFKMLWKHLRSGIKEWDTMEMEPRCLELDQMINKITRSVKEIASGLRSDLLEQFGIVEAISGLCQDFVNRHQIECKTRLPEEPVEIDESVAIALFRIIQETLTNVVRHAHASHVEVHLTMKKKQLAVQVKDDGVGFSIDQVSGTDSLGIIGIRERVSFLNGEFNIISKIGEGTSVNVTIPLKTEYVLEQN